MARLPAHTGGASHHLVCCLMPNMLPEQTRTAAVVRLFGGALFTKGFFFGV